MSTVSERQRLDLYERLGETLGRESAEVLMEYLPPVGWNDVVRRHDLDRFRAEVRTELAEIRTEMHGLRVEMHQQLSRQLVWIIASMFSCVGMVLGLIAYVN